MNLDPELLEILACPCPRHESLVVDEERQALVCRYCATAFEVRDDIPILLLDEAQPGPAGVGVAPGDAG